MLPPSCRRGFALGSEDLAEWVEKGSSGVGEFGAGVSGDGAVDGFLQPADGGVEAGRHDVSGHEGGSEACGGEPKTSK